MYGSSCFCEMDLSDINKNYDIFEYIDKNVTVGDYPSFLGYLQQNYTSDSSFYKCVFDSIEKDQIMEYFPPNFSDLNDKCADLVQNQQQILEWNTYSYDTTNKTTCSELRSIVKNSITQKKDPKLQNCQRCLFLNKFFQLIGRIFN
ncbi:hypothetical protein PPERSA_12043 [Pseudocohnilembus persalinus]|uniref:Uncharacterized protein n=1 Tax=Pseudocohnilembus persalinus TaxID=266149 RepID=A0A0V0R8V2_PSEPJ|nr:hypothetical protein PPERSA_12043 [Pseudocohnilembus persalinus]|eukprot:KRX10919.1 hypothetical protein PPERSA_12043 [Pseudocohnilembus persalinus]